MAISFIHAADIHLDSPLKGLERYENAPVERIRGATRRAFTRLIDLAIDKAVDFVLISGDLYDGDWRDYNTGLYLVRELGRLRDLKIPVIIIAGNHDAANKMTRALRLPENVRFLAHEHPETVLLKDLGVAIHGQSFARPAIMENLAVAYPAPVAAIPISGCFIPEWAGWMATNGMPPVRSKTFAFGDMITGPWACPRSPDALHGATGRFRGQRAGPAYS